MVAAEAAVGLVADWEAEGWVVADWGAGSAAEGWVVAGLAAGSVAVPEGSVAVGWWCS